MLITDINILTDDEIQAEMEVARLERRTISLQAQTRFRRDPPVEVHSGPIPLRKTYLYSIIIDVTARTAAEEALARSEWTYRHSFRKHPHGNHPFRLSEDRGQLGFHDHRQTPARPLGLDITTIPDQRIILNFIEALSGKLSRLSRPLSHHPGEKEIFVRVKIALPDKTGFNGGIAVVEDLTDEKRREDERDLIEGRLRDEQTSSVGTLAGRIAHEVNNPRWPSSISPN